MLQNYTDGFSRSHKKLIEMELFFCFLFVLCHVATEHWVCGFKRIFREVR